MYLEYVGGVTKQQATECFQIRPELFPFSQTNLLQFLGVYASTMNGSDSN